MGQPTVSFRPDQPGLVPSRVGRVPLVDPALVNAILKLMTQNST